MLITQFERNTWQGGIWHHMRGRCALKKNKTIFLEKTKTNRPRQKKGKS